MLYAQMNQYKGKGKGIEWPLDWEKCHDMFQYLQRMTWGYQLNLEKKMFATQYGAEYRCVLVKWEEEIPRAQHTQTNLPKKKREVLLETTDPAQMEAALFMLINDAEPAYKAAKNRVTNMAWTASAEL